MELKYSNFNEVEALFTRCLKTVLSVDLWKFYLGYIRRINQGDSGTAATPEARAIIEKAYEYVLNNVGIDKDAGPIWADYIFFLKSAEVRLYLLLCYPHIQFSHIDDQYMGRAKKDGQYATRLSKGRCYPAQ